MSIKFIFKDKKQDITSRNNLCKVENCPNKTLCKKLTCKYCKKYGHGVSCCFKLLRKKQQQTKNLLEHKHKHKHNQNYTLQSDFLPIEKTQKFYSMLKNNHGNYPISVSNTTNHYASYETNITRHNHQTKIVMSVSESITVKYEKM